MKVGYEISFFSADKKKTLCGQNNKQSNISFILLAALLILFVPLTDTYGISIHPTSLVLHGRIHRNMH